MKKIPRDHNKIHNPVKWEFYIQAIKILIKDLQNMTKTHVKAFFPDQYDMMMQTLSRAFLQHENNSLLLLARTKQTLNALTSQV